MERQTGVYVEKIPKTSGENFHCCSGWRNSCCFMKVMIILIPEIISPIPEASLSHFLSADFLKKRTEFLPWNTGDVFFELKGSRSAADNITMFCFLILLQKKAHMFDISFTRGCCPFYLDRNIFHLPLQNPIDFRAIVISPKLEFCMRRL